MPLYFTEKKRHWPPPKPVQYILAITLLVIALSVLIGWLLLRFVYTAPQPEEPPQDTSAISPEDLPDAGYCLIIVEDVEYERFAIVNTLPKDSCIKVTAVSPDTQTADGTLRDILKKHGPARAAKSVSNTLSLPEMHFLSFSISDIETLFTRLGENLVFSVPEEISYKDENGAIIRLKAESRKLTPSQVAALFRYDQWKDTNNGNHLAADITTAVINNCLRPGKSLKGYFELLANTASTDLRIDQFNAYALGWEHLASINEGMVAQCLPSNKELS